MACDNRPVTPEIRSLLARAATNRYLLNQLIEQVPAGAWDRTAAGEPWSARVHLCHLATIDDVMALVLGEPEGGAFRLGADLQSERMTSLGAILERPVADVLVLMAESRQRFTAAVVATCDDATLAMPVIIATPDAWPTERQVSLRAYLAAWAEHDVEHTAAIRSAIATPPSARDLSLAAWFTRR